MKKISMFLSLLVMNLLVASCSSNNGRLPGQSPVIVDTKGVDMRSYEQDLADCQAYAEEINVGEKAVVRGATGAVVGGAVGAVFNGSRGAERGAGAGAVLGTAKGASEGIKEKEQVVRRCLSGRGYRVLN